MSFGYNNSQNNDFKTMSLKSKLSFINEGKLNYSSLRIEYFNGLIAFKVVPCIKTQDGSTKLNQDGAITIYLTPMKAKVLYDSILYMIENKNEYKSLGIDSSNGLITFSFGEDYGLSGTPMIAIRKISEEGSILSSLTYEFSSALNPISNFDEENPQNIRAEIFNENSQELHLVLEALSQFIKNSNGANAYWNNYSYEYYTYKENELVKKIAASLGIDVSTKNSYSKPSSSFFGNGNRNQQGSDNRAGNEYNSANDEELF